MQRIPVIQLIPGMVIARNVYKDDGNKLIAANTTITGPFISRLISLRIPAVYVATPYTEGSEGAQVITEEFRIKTTQTVKRVFCLLESLRPEAPCQEVQGFGKKFVVEVLRKKNSIVLLTEIKRELQALAKKIVSEVMQNKNALLQFNEIKTFDSYAIDHAVNVSISSVMIATRLQYTMERMCDLAVGALLLEAGKVLIDSSILRKAGLLTEEEMVIMKGHAALGFELLRQSGREVSAPAMHVAFQHHERFDGKGYPRGLKSAEIHEYARIAAIADVYDALISDRPYRPALLPHEAYEVMLASGGSHFDPELLKIFLSTIAIYPIGTIVQLNRGTIGIVIAAQQATANRPNLRLVLDENAALYPCNTDLDLRTHLALSIEKVICDKTIFDLVGKQPRDSMQNDCKE